MNILIVGATSGIGNALWQHYVSQNHNVAIIGRRVELLNVIKSEAPTHTFPYEADIADISSLNHTFDEILKELHSLDLVIVCAGIGELNPKLNVDTELLTIATNVVGWTNILDRSYYLFEQQNFGHLVRDIQEIGYAVGWLNGLRLRYPSTWSVLAQNIQFSEPIFEKNLACGHEWTAPMWAELIFFSDYLAKLVAVRDESLAFSLRIFAVVRRVSRRLPCEFQRREATFH
jgi:hypothetical protein